MSKYPDLTGQVFGLLTVQGKAQSSGEGARWLCLCRCGRTTTVPTRRLRGDHTRSCGCSRYTPGQLPPREPRAVVRRQALDDALREVAAGWPASLARYAQEAISRSAIPAAELRKSQ